MVRNKTDLFIELVRKKLIKFYVFIVITIFFLVFLVTARKIEIVLYF